MNYRFEVDQERFCLNCGGVDVVVFGDHSASAHQSGLTLIMNDRRMANGGDVRFEQTPGQWQPVPAFRERVFNEESGALEARLHFPDTNMHLRGFNPLIYPDVELDYKICVKPHQKGVKISVILEQELPECLKGKACFHLEFVPVYLVGKSYLMDDMCGIFPAQPNGPTMAQPANIDLAGVYDRGSAKADLTNLVGDRTYYSPIVADDCIGVPYAEGHCFTACPESDTYRFTIHSKDALLKLYDGRMNHNNGWFVISSELPVNQTGNVLEWYLEPAVDEQWRYPTVLQVSQVGYHTDQPKVAVMECDRNNDNTEMLGPVQVMKLTPSGRQCVYEGTAALWGDFLRYRYYHFDFSHIKENGMYQLRFGEAYSTVFKIGNDIYDRGVWQPVLEYFLPVQMCHMMVREKYRIWHGLCHKDDAVMAPVDYNHFDGYYQGPDTLCEYKSGDHVPGLDHGGWHDAGDYDLRVESQAGEVYVLSLVYEAFGINYDATTIDQEKRLTEIHRPDGKNDLLQQIEHGLLTILGGYRSLGRLYRGIICRDLRQYVLLGDASDMTDGIESDDDRWVFTEDNPYREFTVAAQLSAASRNMYDYDKALADEALRTAQELYERTKENGCATAKMHAAIELFLTTGDEIYKKYILDNREEIREHFDQLGWIAVRLLTTLKDPELETLLRECAIADYEKIQMACEATPYGVPYKPGAWGSGWGIEGFGAHYYFLHQAFPEIYPLEPMLNALHFVLGVHPGSNTAAFASGVGAKSATAAYGANRADYSYIPGGVISGTELINPDLPELLEFPFLWQQGEYVLGGGSSNYMFLVLAVINSLKNV